MLLEMPLFFQLWMQMEHWVTALQVSVKVNLAVDLEDTDGMEMVGVPVQVLNI